MAPRRHDRLPKSSLPRPARRHHTRLVDKGGTLSMCHPLRSPTPVARRLAPTGAGRHIAPRSFRRRKTRHLARPWRRLARNLRPRRWRGPTWYTSSTRCARRRRPTNRRPSRPARPEPVRPPTARGRLGPPLVVNTGWAPGTAPTNTALLGPFRSHGQIGGGHRGCRTSPSWLPPTPRERRWLSAGFAWRHVCCPKTPPCGGAPSLAFSTRSTIVTCEHGG